MSSNKAISISVQAIDLREFARFFITGVTATVGNLAAVWISRPSFAYQSSLFVGVATGFTISFIMSKIFAFRSNSWANARSEFVRFIIVYGIGVFSYWNIAMVAGHLLLPHFLPVRISELAGAFLGAASMTFTSYFGHRFFTYRSGFQAPLQ